MSEVKNICPNCGGDIEALKEMFPDGWTTCEELQRRKTMKETKFRAMAGGVMVYFDLFTIVKAWDDDSFLCKNHLTVSRNSTLMEYTGLKDKNGVGCYFDDLAKWDNAIYQVVWDDDRGIAKLKYIKGKTVWNTTLQISKIRMMELFGNIHEEAGNGS